MPAEIKGYAKYENIVDGVVLGIDTSRVEGSLRLRGTHNVNGFVKGEDSEYDDVRRVLNSDRY